MKFVYLIPILFMLACTTAPKPGAPSKLGPKTCEKIPGTKHPAELCIWKTCEVSNGSMIYWHGLMENVNAPDGSSSAFPIPGQREGGHPELVPMAKDKCLDVAVMSYGTSWMIRPPNTLAMKPPSPSWDEMKNKVLPFLKSKLVRPFTGYGQSMGGFNVSTIAHLDPDFHDAGVIITHPVMGPMPEWFQFFLPGGLANIPKYSFLVASHFTGKEWKIANPVVWASTVTKFPRAYIAACAKDEFGLYTPVVSFANLLKSRGFDVTYHEESANCSHTSLDVQPILEWQAKK